MTTTDPTTLLHGVLADLRALADERAWTDVTALLEDLTDPPTTALLHVAGTDVAAVADWLAAAIGSTVRSLTIDAALKRPGPVVAASRVVLAIQAGAVVPAATAEALAVAAGIPSAVHILVLGDAWATAAEVDAAVGNAQHVLGPDPDRPVLVWAPQPVPAELADRVAGAADLLRAPADPTDLLRAQLTLACAMAGDHDGNGAGAAVTAAVFDEVTGLQGVLLTLRRRLLDAVDDAVGAFRTAPLGSAGTARLAQERDSVVAHLRQLSSRPAVTNLGAALATERVPAPPVLHAGGTGAAPSPQPDRPSRTFVQPLLAASGAALGVLIASGPWAVPSAVVGTGLGLAAARAIDNGGTRTDEARAIEAERACSAALRAAEREARLQAETSLTRYRNAVTAAFDRAAAALGSDVGAPPGASTAARLEAITARLHDMPAIPTKEQ